LIGVTVAPPSPLAALRSSCSVLRSQYCTIGALLTAASASIMTWCTGTGGGGGGRFHGQCIAHAVALSDSIAINAGLHQFPPHSVCFIMAAVRASPPSGNTLTIRESAGLWRVGKITHMRTLAPINIMQWIDANRHLLRPPVGNKVIYQDGEFVVMVVGGPNARKDFHVDPAEEFFYQLEGEMRLRVVEDGRITDLPLRAGDILLLPPGVPHSPQRFAGSVGMVIERRRRPGELDGLQWYCERCEHLLYQDFFQLTDIETQFPPVFNRFFGSLSLRTCKHCGAVMEPPLTPAGAHGSQ
jgi:3-hydroxyanthranilate 3,4-dioxygenase